MKRVRTALSWIALAAISSALPFPPLILPSSAALAIGVQLLRRARPQGGPAGALLAAGIASWTRFGLVLAEELARLLHLQRLSLWHAMALSAPVALWLVAHGLAQLSGSLGDPTSRRWMNAVGVLFGGWLVLDGLQFGSGVLAGLFACLSLAVLVLQMRSNVRPAGAQ